MEGIVKTAQLGQITGIPKDIGKYDVKCPLCVIAAGTKIPRGNLRDCTEYRKGSCFHFDFAIFNTESCRGFVCGLVIVEVRTRMKFGFLARSRSPPIEQLKYFIQGMRQKGYTDDVARVDEDGALACSAEFMHTLTVVLHMTVETTGGYNSTNNGMVESPIKPIKRMTRSFLIGAAFPDTLWCFAFIYAICIMNHRYNRMIQISQFSFGTMVIMK